jgi:hypothetical protein
MTVHNLINPKKTGHSERNRPAFSFYFAPAK